MTTTTTIARVGIVVFPGSNCELDCRQAFEHLGASTEFVWHDDASLPDVSVGFDMEIAGELDMPAYDGLTTLAYAEPIR